MSSYHWIITKDHQQLGSAGVLGPSGARLSAEQIREHPKAQPFQMRDDDGELYFEGVYVGPEDERLFAPLDDYGLPTAGCTEIQYRNEAGNWETL